MGEKKKIFQSKMRGAKPTKRADFGAKSYINVTFWAILGVFFASKARIVKIGKGSVKKEVRFLTVFNGFCKKKRFIFIYLEKDAFLKSDWFTYSRF